MPPPSFTPGFRLSTLDVIVLVVGGAAALALGTVTWWWGFVVAFVLGHFFLFCNLVRMARPLELTWAAGFIALAGATIAFDAPGWLVTAGASLAMTLALVALAMRKPSYHGVGWRWINPQLPVWWEAQAAADDRDEGA